MHEKVQAEACAAAETEDMAADEVEAGAAVAAKSDLKAYTPEAEQVARTDLCAAAKAEENKAAAAPEAEEADFERQVIHVYLTQMKNCQQFPNFSSLPIAKIVQLFC